MTPTIGFSATFDWEEIPGTVVLDCYGRAFLLFEVVPVSGDASGVTRAF